MSARAINIVSVKRLAGNEIIDQLNLEPGVNVVVGAKDTGKTGWLRTISFLLGSMDGAEGALGSGLATKFDSVRLQLVVDGTKTILLERRWTEQRYKHKIFVNGEPVASEDFSARLCGELDIPVLRYPKRSFHSGGWPELSWQMLFRHIYREERSWSSIAERQSEREQHACLLQFLGVAKLVYPTELDEEIQLRQELLRLRTRKEQFNEVLKQAARGLSADPSLALTRDSIGATIKQLRDEVASLQRRREEILVTALSAKSARTSKRADTIRQFGERRVELVAQRKLQAESLDGITQRINELSTYRSSIADELTRIKRVEFAVDIFRPLNVKRCPHCDQSVAPERAQSGMCFVCLQHLPSNVTATSGTKQRLAFEQEQLKNEDDELRELVKKLINEQDVLRLQLVRIDADISEIDVRLQPTQSTFAAAVPPGLETTDVHVGQLEERIAQLLWIQEALQQTGQLDEQIEALEAKIEAAVTQVDAKNNSFSFEHLSSTIEDGINEYLKRLNEGDSTRWEHNAVRFRLGERGLKLQVGDAPLSSLGMTSVGLVLLGYHYALLKLTEQGDFNYPGLVLIDFPMTLADGTSIASKENYLIEPFISLASENTAIQVIVCGRAFEGLAGVHRTQLDKVWVQGEAPGFTSLAQLPLDTNVLELPVSANFHSGKKQIVMVLHARAVARLAEFLPDLGDSIRAKMNWPGKVVIFRWKDGRYETKLGHNIDNGNVKFTVSKTHAPALWGYLHDLLLDPSPKREFTAHYTKNSGDTPDEFFVDVQLPENRK